MATQMIVNGAAAGPYGYKLTDRCSNHSVGIEMTNITALQIAIEGRLIGMTKWITLYTYTATVGNIIDQSAWFSFNGVPSEEIRLNIKSIAGGGTINAWHIDGRI